MQPIIHNICGKVYECRTLEEGDVRHAEIFMSRFLEETKGKGYSLAGIGNFVGDPDFIGFGIFHGEELIGIRYIHSPTHELTGLAVLRSYKDRRLSNMLYDAAILYMLEYTSEMNAFVEIEAANISSMRAATQNGFVFQKEKPATYAGIFAIYAIHLEPLRQFRELQIRTGSVWGEPDLSCG